MAFVTPSYTNGQVNRAGEILVAPDKYAAQERDWAEDVLANFRAAHSYPMNTFQATLRTKLKHGYGPYIVAQRLKRAPSVIAKLQRFEGMQLSRMQDIGGLRAIVSDVRTVRRLEEEYRRTPFTHELKGLKDYIAEPKDDGYRSIHLIYRYANDRARAYKGLSVELQFRTKLQHAWATAVETMGTFLGQALKSGQGEGHWRMFFTEASAAIALIEKTPAVPGFEGLLRDEVFERVARTEKQLNVLDKLEGFALAAGEITAVRGQGSYHLIVLDSARRSVTLTPYAITRLDEANAAYAAVELRTRSGEPVEAVLVSAGPVSELRKAYPNYFLDTQDFVTRMRNVVAHSAEKPRTRTASTLRRRR